MTNPTNVEDINVEFLVICDYATATPDGKLTMVGAFELINAPTLPITLPAMGVAARVRMRGEDVSRKRALQIRMKGPDGSVLLNIDGGFQQGANAPISEFGTTLPIAIMFGNVVFSKYGEHRIEIWIDKRRAQALSLHVVRPSSENRARQAAPAAGRMSAR